MKRLTQESWRITPNYYPIYFDQMLEATVDDSHIRVGISADNSIWGPFQYLKISVFSYKKFSQIPFFQLLNYRGEVVTTPQKLEIIRTLPMFGKEFVGLEIYPPESQLVNEANMYHLWMFKKSEFHPPFSLNAKGIQYTSQGNIIHEWIPPTIDWAKKQVIKNEKFGLEACGMDVLDSENEYVHFVCLPRGISLPPELTI